MISSYNPANRSVRSGKVRMCMRRCVVSCSVLTWSLFWCCLRREIIALIALSTRHGGAASCSRCLREAAVRLELERRTHVHTMILWFVYCIIRSAAYMSHSYIITPCRRTLESERLQTIARCPDAPHPINDCTYAVDLIAMP